MPGPGLDIPFPSRTWQLLADAFLRHMPGQVPGEDGHGHAPAPGVRLLERIFPSLGYRQGGLARFQDGTRSVCDLDVHLRNLNVVHRQDPDHLARGASPAPQVDLEHARRVDPVRPAHVLRLPFFALRYGDVDGVLFVGVRISGRLADGLLARLLRRAVLMLRPETRDCKGVRTAGDFACPDP